MIDLARRVLPDCLIVVGGPHFTIFPDNVPPEVDYVVVGEGELAMPAIVENMLPTDVMQPGQRFNFIVHQTGEPLYDGQSHFTFQVAPVSAVPSANKAVQVVGAEMRECANQRTRVVIMRGRLSSQTLGWLPYPAYDLFLSDEVSYQFDEPALGLDGKMLNLNTSRGCSYGCSFCSVEGVWGKAYRWFPSDWIIGLVSDLTRRYGVRSVFFREDQFIMGPRAPSAWRDGKEPVDEVMKLAAGLHACGVRWAVENRADAFGSVERAESYFKKLAELGLSGVFVGVESASERVRNAILNKHISTETIRRFFGWAHQAGVKTVANVMYGVRRQINGTLLHDSEEDWTQTEVLLAEINPTRIDRYVYVGVPVSPMYTDHIERGDYDFIDVNGYLYPKGFADLAHRIYRSSVEMAISPGNPNVRVGPGLLPGIPTAAEAAPSWKTITEAITRLRHLPGVLELNLTALRTDRESVPSDWGVLNDFMARSRCTPLARTFVNELLGSYRPGAPARVRRLRCGPTVVVATIRSPSAEAILLTLTLSHSSSSVQSILAVATRVVHLVNTHIQSEFVSRYARCSGGPRLNARARSHLRGVG
jgi:hypothetical protein